MATKTSPDSHRTYLKLLITDFASSQYKREQQKSSDKISAILRQNAREILENLESGVGDQFLSKIYSFRDTKEDLISKIPPTTSNKNYQILSKDLFQNNKNFYSENFTQIFNNNFKLAFEKSRIVNFEELFLALELLAIAIYEINTEKDLETQSLVSYLTDLAVNLLLQCKILDFLNFSATSNNSGVLSGHVSPVKINREFFARLNSNNSKCEADMDFSLTSQFESQTSQTTSISGISNEWIDLSETVKDQQHLVTVTPNVMITPSSTVTTVCDVTERSQLTSQTVTINSSSVKLHSERSDQDIQKLIAVASQSDLQITQQAQINQIDRKSSQNLTSLSTLEPELKTIKSGYVSPPHDTEAGEASSPKLEIYHSDTNEANVSIDSTESCTTSATTRPSIVTPTTPPLNMYSSSTAEQMKACLDNEEKMGKEDLDQEQEQENDSDSMKVPEKDLDIKKVAIIGGALAAVAFFSIKKFQ